MIGAQCGGDQAGNSPSLVCYLGPPRKPVGPWPADPDPSEPWALLAGLRPRFAREKR